MAVIPTNSPLIKTVGKDSSNRDSIRVLVGNDSAIPVTLDSTSQVRVDYNEVTGTGLDTLTIIDKTISAGTELTLRHADCSSDNRAIFTVEINTNLKFKKRIYLTNYNLSFELNNIVLSEGDNIKIIVENKTNNSGNYNASLIYNEASI